jgi:predicted Rossmann-fold nucleotide-binding protein
MGTLDETFEILTWAQLGMHAKPVGLLDVANYYGPLLTFLDHAMAHGFVRAEHRALLDVAGDPAALLDRLARRPLARSDIRLDPGAR